MGGIRGGSVPGANAVDAADFRDVANAETKGRDGFHGWFMGR